MKKTRFTEAQMVTILRKGGPALGLRTVLMWTREAAHIAYCPSTDRRCLTNVAWVTILQPHASRNVLHVEPQDAWWQERLRVSASTHANGSYP